MALSKDYAYYIDRDRIALIEKSTTSGDWDSISTSGKTVRIFTNGIPSSITAATNMTSEISLAIPARYHEGIMNLAIALAYLSASNLDPEKHMIFKNLYNEELKRAKKFKKMGNRTVGFIKPQEF